jgi:CHAD domain-containing protein
LLQELNQAVDQDLNNYQNLHQVRIFGKRLRYAMEIFAPCFEGIFKEQFYPAVVEMQEILGQANDSFVAGQRLQVLRTHLQTFQPAEWKRFKPGIEALLRFHQRRLPQQRRQFLQWWQHWRESGSEGVFESLVRGTQVAASS